MQSYLNGLYQLKSKVQEEAYNDYPNEASCQSTNQGNIKVFFIDDEDQANIIS